MEPSTQFRKDVLSILTNGEWYSSVLEPQMEKIAQLVDNYGHENLTIQRNWYPHKNEYMIQVMSPRGGYFSKCYQFGAASIGLYLEILREDFGYFKKFIDF
jgi:hypothetical protein